MVDVFDRATRSRIMSRIRSKSGLDRRVHNWLCGMHIRHRMWPKVEGNPDVYLRDAGVYLFLDGDFWHCGPEYRRPKSNVRFWVRHVEAAERRRRRLRARLPYRWVRIWGSQVESGEFKRILREVLDGAVAR